MKKIPWGQGSAFGLFLACALGAHADSFTLSTIAGFAGMPGDLDGTNNTARLKGPAGLALDSGGAIYFTDASAVRQASLIGGQWIVTTLAGVAASHGQVDATNANARFDLPEGLVVDPATNIYIADTINNAIRKLERSDTNWVATTIAGAGRLDPGTADGTNTNAQFDHPYGLARDASGNLFVADTFNETIRKLTLQDTNWIVSTIAGSAGVPGNADGTNSVARFNGPAAIAFDAVTGNFYVADFANNTVRALSASGTNWVVTTVAGQAGAFGSTDGTNANARFNGPAGVAVDVSGNIYVCDSSANIVRILKRFGTNWVVSTLAGSPGLTGWSNGTGIAARMSEPTGIAVNSAGRAFVADRRNYTLRQGQLAILLQARLLPGQLSLSWPTGAVGFVLETAPALPASSWQAISNGVVTAGDTFVFTTNRTAPRAIYRLHKP